MIFLATSTTATAVFDHKGWHWQRTLEADSASGFVRMPVMPEVLDQSQATLDDLRVLDSDKNLVPHVVHWGRVRDRRQMVWLPARLLNQTFIPSKYARVTIDFQEKTEKNRIKVALSEVNYRRRILIEGSNDSASWEVVAEDLWLFDVNMQGHNFKLDTLKFPRNNFRYLRLTVYNMEDDPRRISIESARGAFNRTESKKELVAVPVKRLQISHDDKKRQSIFELDLGFRNLPVVMMACEIDTPYFYRGYALLGRNQAVQKVQRKTESGWQTVERNVPWKTVRKGVLYRTRYKQKISESLNLEGFNAPYRYLQLRVFNGDNPPLQLKRALFYRRDTSLVFQAKARQTYTLIGGNAKARPPDYDLAKAVRGLDEFNLPLVHPGPADLLEAPQEEVLPFSERHADLILMSLIVAVGVMLVFIIKNLKSLPGKNNAAS